MKRSSAMKRLTTSVTDIGSGNTTPRRPNRRRKGSILIVVIALLGMLLLLGLAFYSFASQEQVSAEYFADSAKKTSDPGLSSDTLFDFAMEQLTVGPSQKLTQSALWGRRYSLVGTMLGTNANSVSTDPNKDGHFDTVLYDGQGINLNLDTSGGNKKTIVDQDYDNNPDNANLLDVNYSFAAQGAGGSSTNPPLTPQPDVDYTYPDINNMFLAYISDTSNDINGRRVIVPSFHRPQILRNNTGTTVIGAGTGGNWYDADGSVDSNYTLTRRSFRPHPLHKTASGSHFRFIRTTASAAPYTDATDDVAILNVLGQTIQPFPFAANKDSDMPAVSGEMGVWTGANDNYDLDSDNDGDGVNEGVWLDLDFPVQELPDGRKYVPLFSFTVLDADGLINLNTAGNLSEAEYTTTDVKTTLLNGAPLSNSNLGVSRSEVSPLWALYADPENSATFIQTGHTKNDDLKQYCLFWGITSTPTVPRQVMANLELINLAWGRPDFVIGTTNNNYTNSLYADPMSNPNGYFKPGDYKIGRWGEQQILENGTNAHAPASRATALFPRAGTSGIDDDGDAATGLGSGTGTSGYDPLTLASNSLPFPSVIQPLDLTGLGNFVDLSASMTAPGRKAYLTHGNYADPNRWLTYAGYQDPGPVGTTWTNVVPSGLMVAPVLSSLSAMGAIPTPADEDDEMVNEPLASGTAGALGQAIKNDSAFGPEELVGLHVADNDYANIAGSSRIRDLAPFNFQANKRAAEIRRQFTTLSFDRAEYGTPPSVYRAWENTNFPPTYFRSLVGKLFYNSTFAPSISFPVNSSQRLMLNGVLVGLDAHNRPQYRALTPHPAGLANTAVTAPSNAAQLFQGTATPSSPNDQEYLARYDRQTLAQDIYLLLYTLGGGKDGTDYSTTPASSLYTDMQLKEMAQFAVNVVDQLDRDNVITQFEYDNDLSDGWSLDGNPYTADSTGQRKVVYGVEAQQLTFSEWLCVRMPQATSSQPNHPVTRHDDKMAPVEGYYYTYLELRNASPHDVDLSNWGWRIRKVGIGGDTRLTLHGETGNANTKVNAGGQYLIASTTNLESDSNGKYMSSDLRLDYDKDMNHTYNRVYPRVTENPAQAPVDTTTNPAPGADLDLVYNYNSASGNPTDKFIVSDTSNSAQSVGAFFRPTTIPGLSEEVTLVLERRVNLQRTPPTNQAADDDDNPWVTVDVMRLGTTPTFPVQLMPLDMATPTNDTESALRFTDPTYTNGKIRSIISLERVQPLSLANAQSTLNSGGTAGTPDLEPTCTLGFGTKNAASPTTFSLWQPHFDREFTSAFDLLHIPLYGPTRDDNSVLVFDMNGVPQTGTPTNDLLRNCVPGRLQVSQDMAQTMFDQTGNLATTDFGVELVSAKKFLRPDYTCSDMTASGDAKYDNRWYRILELVEVPTRSNMAVQDQVSGTSLLQRWPGTTIPRLPGAINLNTIRQRGVLAGLVDDPNGHMSSYATNSSAAMATMLVDPIETTRDWWRQFVLSRDTIDPVSNLVLPGLPGSRPYRSMSFADWGAGSLQNTLLRDLVTDTTNGFTTPAQRNLFEARSQTDLVSGGGTNQIDYYTRHRLLRKIANNSTQRSNVFIVWVTVEFFEAAEVAAGEVRIGGKLVGDTTRYRGFFVVDRSKLEKAISSSDANGVSFDFRKLIVHQKTLQ